MGSHHQPVLVDEVIGWLVPHVGVGGVFVDGTAGAGGHAVALARRLGPEGRLIGLDRDPEMLALARAAVQEAGIAAEVTWVHAAYRAIRQVLGGLGIDRVQGIVLDLGLSSDQLAREERGFSFAGDGPLDMRFDHDEEIPTAADLVNRLPENELANVFFELGEERYSRRIARRIVEQRKLGPIRTTSELAAIVRRCLGGRGKRQPIDPATRVFQALRIAVNDELGQLDEVLRLIPEVLAPGGRAGIISFHSLEDRRVKWAFKSDPRLNVLTRKPVTAMAGELAVNPRARSAKLRVVERCPNPS
jgi:16S rRNA (cytosine1402-N4)-methyltransferase